MTLFQFKLLNETEQIETAWNSPLLATIEDNDFTYDLHQIDSFYVEVKYRKPNRAIIGLKTFKNPRLLKPYLHKIDIKL